MEEKLSVKTILKNRLASFAIFVISNDAASTADQIEKESSEIADSICRLVNSNPQIGI